MNVKVTSVSSKGQIVIPSDIREQLGISTGTNLLVFTDGSNLLLKPINSPKLESFERLIRDSRKLVTSNKLNKGDVNTIIKKIRAENRA